MALTTYKRMPSGSEAMIDLRSSPMVKSYTKNCTMRFKEIEEDLFVGKAQLNPGFDDEGFTWYPMINIIRWEDCELDPEYKYSVELTALSADLLEKNEEIMKFILECIPNYHSYDIEGRLGILHRYIGGAVISCMGGNNLRKLMRDTRAEADVSAGLCGFVFDRPQNRLGATGWDILRGYYDPLLVPQKEEDE